MCDWEIQLFFPVNKIVQYNMTVCLFHFLSVCMSLWINLSKNIWHFFVWLCLSIYTQSYCIWHYRAIPFKLTEKLCSVGRITMSRGGTGDWMAMARNICLLYVPSPSYSIFIYLCEYILHVCTCVTIFIYTDISFYKMPWNNNITDVNNEFLFFIFYYILSQQI